MKLNWMAAGMSAALLALAASAPLAFAQTGGSYVIAQAEDEALAEAQAIIAEAGNIQSLSEDELKQRIKKARQLSRSESLPDDVKEGLKSFVSAARQELVARESQQQQQQTEQPPAEQPQPEQQTEQPPPQPEQQVTEPEAAPAAPAVDDEALARANALLSETRPASELSVDELKQRMRQARRLSADDNLPADIRDQLKAIVDASRQELAARESQQQQQTEQPPPPPPQPEQQVEQPPPPAEDQQATPAPELKVEQPEQQVTEPEAAPAAPAAAVDDKALAQANKLLSDPRPSSELSVNDLRERIRLARRLSANEKLPSDVRDQLKGIVEASRQEIVSRETKSEQPTPAQTEIANVQQAPPPPSAAENRAVEQPKVSNAAEEQAQKLLADNTPLDRLKDEQIRDRLDAY
ncbi:MAG TPA: hypothetical protein VKA79_12755, partial [Aestuariivirgaceae bacterium]|nr:hypothetical protein [Aestuariivirgaceae bacterium]